MRSMPSWLSAGVGGEPILFLHGMGSTASVWLPQLEYFGASQQVIAWTAPGYGCSKDMGVLSWEALAHQVIHVIDKLDASKVHVVGHSIGGMIAQMVYHLYPDRVRSLTLSASSAGFGSLDPSFQREFIEQRQKALDDYPTFALAAPRLLEGLVGPQITPLWKGLGVLSAQGITKEAYLSYMQLLLTFNQKEAFSRIDVPVMLLAGELDTQAPPKGMQRLAQQLPQSQFHLFEQVSHMANLEVVDEFNQVLSTFFKTQGVTKA